MLIIFLITFPYSAETVQLPPRMTRMTKTISVLKILQLFSWKAPISPPFGKGNHKHTYHLLWVKCTTSAKLKPQKFVLLDGSVELLEFTGCSPHGSCCSEHSPGVTRGPEEVWMQAQLWCWRSAWPHTQEMCSKHSLSSVDAAIRERKAEEAASLGHVKRNRGGGKSTAGDRGEFRKWKKIKR